IAASTSMTTASNFSRTCPITDRSGPPRHRQAGSTGIRHFGRETTATPNGAMFARCKYHANIYFFDEITYISKIIEQITMSIDKNEFRKYAIKHHRIGSQHVDSFIGRVESKMPTSLTPYIIEERQMNVAQMDVFSRLMMDRIIFMGDPVGDQVANIIQAQLLFLQSADAQRDIQIYIN